MPLTRRKSSKEAKGRFLMIALASVGLSPSKAARSSAAAELTETGVLTPAAARDDRTIGVCALSFSDNGVFVSREVCGNESAGGSSR